MRDRRTAGFTLVEVLLALGIGAALLVVVFGGVRVGLAAWGRGEARAATLEHDRTLDQLLVRAVAGAFPYRTASAAGAAAVVFEGQPDRITLVTASPPVPVPGFIAFTTVSITRDAHGLAVRQIALPNVEPVDRLPVVLVDPAVIGLRFRYFSEEAGEWRERWDVNREERLPRAVEIRIATRMGQQVVEQPPLVVSIRALAP